jgi:hypothetical protein
MGKMTGTGEIPAGCSEVHKVESNEQNLQAMKTFLMEGKQKLELEKNRLTEDIGNYRTRLAEHLSNKLLPDFINAYQEKKKPPYTADMSWLQRIRYLGQRPIWSLGYRQILEKQPEIGKLILGDQEVIWPFYSCDCSGLNGEKREIVKLTAERILGEFCVLDIKIQWDDYLGIAQFKRTK